MKSVLRGEPWVFTFRGKKEKKKKKKKRRTTREQQSHEMQTRYSKQ